MFLTPSRSSSVTIAPGLRLISQLPDQKLAQTMAHSKRHSWLQSPVLVAVFAAFSLLVLAGCGGGGLVDRIGNFWSYGFCSALIVVLDVVALLEVLKSDRSSGDKIIWTVIIVLFPFLGCIFYYFFGRK